MIIYGQYRKSRLIPKIIYGQYRKSRLIPKIIYGLFGLTGNTFRLVRKVRLLFIVHPFNTV